MMIATVQEVLAVNACISTGGTKSECQTTRTFTDEAEALQGNVCSKNRDYILYFNSTYTTFLAFEQAKWNTLDSLPL